MHTCTRVCVQIHRHAHINAVTRTRVNTCAHACLTHVCACVHSYKLACALIHMNTSKCGNKHPQDTHNLAYTQAHHTHMQGSSTGESLRTSRPRAPAPCPLGVAILGGGPAQTADQGAVAQVGGWLGCLAGHPLQAVTPRMCWVPGHPPSFAGSACTQHTPRPLKSTRPPAPPRVGSPACSVAWLQRAQEVPPARGLEGLRGQRVRAWGSSCSKGGT